MFNIKHKVSGSYGRAWLHIFCQFPDCTACWSLA